MIPKKLQRKFEDLCAELKAEDVNIVAVLSQYGKDARFSTKISINPDPTAGLTNDHIVLDAIREIMSSWHSLAHPKTRISPGDATVHSDH